jgi:type II secretory ATPase GspE/PulE/Tfp pilus assembly ATPase PilB-like protein
LREVCEPDHSRGNIERATDIHVEPLENDLRIRYRIDGILHEVAVPPQLRVLQSAIISRLKVMAHMDIAERRLPQDGRMNLQANNQNIDVRVSTIPTVNGESISLRLLSRSEQQFGFDRLDLSKKKRPRFAICSHNLTGSFFSPAQLAAANRPRFIAFSAASIPCSVASLPSKSPWNIGCPAFRKST